VLANRYVRAYKMIFAVLVYGLQIWRDLIAPVDNADMTPVKNFEKGAWQGSGYPVIFGS